MDTEPIVRSSILSLIESLSLQKGRWVDPIKMCFRNLNRHMVPALPEVQRYHQHELSFYRLLYTAKHQGFFHLFNKRFTPDSNALCPLAFFVTNIGLHYTVSPFVMSIS